MPVPQLPVVGTVKASLARCTGGNW
jgi:hypothetical protein